MLHPEPAPTPDPQFTSIDHASQDIAPAAVVGSRHLARQQLANSAEPQLQERTRLRHPARWSGNTRNWSPFGVVTLNPERNAGVEDEPKRKESLLKAA